MAPDHRSNAAWVTDPSVISLKFQGFFGGGNRDRTCDLLNANQMLSQLSYAPTCI